MNSQESFLLPPACKKAIPFFEESDSLRENALFWSDLVAAYCLRWKGVSLCIQIMDTLNVNEKAYVKRVVDILLTQLHNMKHEYNVSSEDGSNCLRRKIKTAFNTCLQYGALPSNVILMEMASLYSYVVMYLDTLDSWSGLTNDEMNLRLFCKIQCAKYINRPISQPPKNIRNRLGLDVMNQPIRMSSSLSLVSDLPADTDHPVMPADGPILPADGPILPADGPVLPADGPILPADGPVLPADGPILPADGPVLPVDGPILPADSPVLPVDGPVMPVDGQVLPVDGPILPVDGPILPPGGSVMSVDGPMLPPDHSVVEAIDIGDNTVMPAVAVSGSVHSFSSFSFPNSNPSDDTQNVMSAIPIGPDVSNSIPAEEVDAPMEALPAMDSIENNPMFMSVFPNRARGVPGQAATSGAVSDSINATLANLQATTNRLNKQLRSSGAIISDDDDIDVEKELGLPSGYNPTPAMDVSPSAAIAAIPERDEDFMELDFSDMPKSKCFFWLNQIMTRACDLAKTIQAANPSPEASQLCDVLEKATECASYAGLYTVCNKHNTCHFDLDAFEVVS